MITILNKFCRTLPFALLISLLLSQAAYAVIDVNKSFSPATIYPKQVSRLTIRLVNSATMPATAVSFTDVFPDNVFFADTPNPTQNCDAGGSLTPVINTVNTATHGELSFSGGGIPAGDGVNAGTCEISVDVVSNTKGTYLNRIEAGDVSATTNGSPETNPQSTNATLAVILEDLGVTLAWSNNTLQAGETVTHTITLTNSNPVDLTGTGFTEDLISMKALSATVANTCGGTVDITDYPHANSSSYSDYSIISFSGGVIPASGSCSISFEVETSLLPTIPMTRPRPTVGLDAGAITTNEGATNTTAVSSRIFNSAGTAVVKTFGGSRVLTVNSLDNPFTTTLELLFQTYNTTDLDSLDFTDIMPAPPAAPAQMNVVSIDSNTCGGSVTTGGGISLSITGGTLPGAPANSSGSDIGECKIVATVSVNQVGSYLNTIPAGAVNGHAYQATDATLNLSGNALSFDKSLSSVRFFQGDETRITYTFTNASDSVTGRDITDLSLVDILEETCSSSSCPSANFKVAPAPQLVSDCSGALVEAVPGTQTIKVNSLTLPKGETCSISLTIASHPDSYPISMALYDRILLKTDINAPGQEGITFQLDNDGNTRIFPMIPEVQTRIDPGLRILKYFNPATVGPLGITRVRIEVRHDSYSRFGIGQITLRDILPAGHTIAASPDVLNECGGTVTATPGSDTLLFNDGLLPAATTNSARCNIYFNIQTPALTPPNTLETATNTIPADGHTDPVADLEVSAVKTGTGELMRNYINASATITRIATAVTANKEFMPPVINGGSVSRVKIGLFNQDPASINLTDVSLTDAFPGSDLRLYSNIDPSFTDAAGSSTGACRQAQFSGIPGGTSITLHGAEIDSSTVCYFEFNVTAFKGGNQINTLDADTLGSREGITNYNSASATLTVNRQLNVAKAFIPATIASGETSTLILDIYNTNDIPNDKTGATPALIDEMPAGITIQSIDSNSCGGTVSTVTQNGNDALRLDGGIFVAEASCQISATVTASTTGQYTNTIAIGDLQATDTSNADAASATLTVIQHPSITKSFAPAAVLTGENSTLRFRLTNPNPSTLLPSGLTQIHFTDVLTDMQIATPMVVSSTCSNFAYQASPGGATFEVTDASLPAGAFCDITLEVSSSVLGDHDNQSSGVSTAQTTTASPPSNVATLNVDQLNITGVVFEDVNYGGGAGRDQATAGTGGAGINGVTVELYNTAGTLVDTVTTGNDGTQDGVYDFAGVTDGDYYVRVVNNTVTSTRTGSNGTERGVQTFRSDGTTPVTGEVGGRNPAVADTLAHASGAVLDTGNFTFSGGMIDGQAQSVTPVTIAGSDITGVDFGFNFDTIVNTNDAGQGSLRQFILNSNLLANTGLAQEGSRKTLDNTDEALPSGVETSIFMIPASQLTDGVAQITLLSGSSLLPAISGSNAAATLIDATTQTVNIGDTNTGLLGSGGTVGVDALVLPQIQRPEVQLAPASSGFNYGLTIGADNAGVRGLALYGFGTDVNANGVIIVNGFGTNALIEQNIIGTSASSFTAPPLQGAGTNVNISGSNGLLRNNLIGFSRGNGVSFRSAAWQVSGNEIYANGTGSADNLWGYGGTSLTIEGNRIANAASGGYDGLTASSFINNTVTGNGQAAASPEDYGVSVVGNGSILSKNIFSGNLGQGILVYNNVQPTSLNNRISQNRMFDNGKLGIDLSNSSSTSGNNVTLNDANDADTGPNNGLNFPQFSQTALVGTNLILQGCAPTGSSIELFEADVSPTSASGVSAGANQLGRTQDYGEGERYLLTLTEGVDEDTVTTPVDCATLTDADGNSAAGMSPFQWTIPLPADVALGDKLTATSTLGSTGTSEFSAISVVAVSRTLSGTVFEDIRYAGGAGRDQATAAGMGVPGTTVELYDATGALVRTTTTAADGSYAFSNLGDETYYVRVVNSTVTSTRTGSNGTERGVQTFRSDGTTPVTGEVGGRNPAVADTLAHASGAVLDTGNFTFSGGMIDGQAQSVTPVTIAGSDIVGVDFGFNFDTIINTNDAGQGSLRQFILNSNLLTDIPAQSLNAGKETSIFMIANGSGYPGTGAHGTLDLTIGGLATIAPVQGLPAVTDANTALDAGTQNGASCAPARNLRIMLDGTGVPASGGTNPPGLELNGPDALLRGWAIGNFSGNGVSIAANGDAAVVLCNHIGLNAAGNAANANHIGLSVLDADDVVIGDNTAAGRNVVSANNNNGILFDGTYANAGVAGNTIGLDADGNGDLGNTMDGVTFWGAATGITVRGNTISGNGQDGLQLGKVGTAGMLSTGALIENNIIGLNAAGTTAVANEARGLYIQDSDNALVQNNTISGNTGVGVILYGLTDGVTLTGNRVGVALGSLDAVGNGGDGISLTGATHTLIGGASGGNIIANNGGDGVSGTATGTGNSVSMNTIYSNTGLGIDLNADDVTLNDANDSDTGANSLLNFPQFNTALLGSNLRIAGCAPTGSSIELFEADVSPTSASGVSAGANQFGRTQDYGEGERYLLTLTEGVDEDTVTTPVDCATLTDADGNSAEGMSPFQWTIPLPADVVVDDLLTATATLNTLGTSEFSPATPLVTIQDYGDAPASYGSPLHTIVSGTHLGLNAPDMETAAAPPLDGSGDDVTGIDDEDGVSMYGFPLDNALINEGTQTLTVDTTGNGYLSAWVDFNRNGDFADAGEQIATNIHSSGGTLYLDFTPPAGMQTGDSYARFRYSSVTGLGPDGNAQPCPTEHEPERSPPFQRQMSLNRPVLGSSGDDDRETSLATPANAG